MGVPTDIAKAPHDSLSESALPETEAAVLAIIASLALHFSLLALRTVKVMRVDLARGVDNSPSSAQELTQQMLGSFASSAGASMPLSASP